MSVRVLDSTAAGVLCWIDAGGPYTPLDLEEADALGRELERRVTDEKVRRAEAARAPSP